MCAVNLQQMRMIFGSGVSIKQADRYMYMEREGERKRDRGKDFAGIFHGMKLLTLEGQYLLLRKVKLLQKMKLTGRSHVGILFQIIVWKNTIFHQNFLRVRL